VPLHKYTRSGNLLFNNIQQYNTAIVKTPNYNRDRNFTSLSVKSSKLGDDSPYMQWSKTREEQSQSPVRATVLKHSSEIKKNLDQMVKYAPEFNAAHMNNYDNTAKYAKRSVVDKYEVSPLRKVPREESDQNKAKPVNIGSSVGPGGRVYLYTCTEKKPVERQQYSSNKLELRKTQ